MTRAWKVGERCWAENQMQNAIDVYTVVAVSGERVALKDEDGGLHVGTAAEISKSRIAVEIVQAARRLERLEFYLKNEANDIVQAKKRHAETRKQIVDAKKRLAALRAKVKP